MSELQARVDRYVHRLFARHLASQDFDGALRDLRPFQLTRPDEKALADLLHTLLRLARAHAGRGRLGLIFPSIEEAEQAARRR